MTTRMDRWGRQFWAKAWLLGWGAAVSVQAQGMDRPCQGAFILDAPLSAHPTVWMVLSPRMPYALQEWPRMRQAARSIGFDVVALRDPRVPDLEWRAALEVADLPELVSAPPVDEVQAARLGVLNHAPASVVTYCGCWHPWPVLGVMPDQAWLTLLRARQADLSTESCAAS